MAIGLKWLQPVLFLFYVLIEDQYHIVLFFASRDQEFQLCLESRCGESPSFETSVRISQKPN